MYIHSVKLINYKSIGDYDESEVILEKGITTIIGKNESGKTNVVEGLSHIKLQNGDDSAFSSTICNRNAGTGAENYFNIILKPSEDEATMGINQDTQIILKKGTYIATGGILELYNLMASKSILSIVEYLEQIGRNPFHLNGQEFDSYNIYKTELSRNEYLNIPKMNSALKFLENKCSRLDNTHRDVFSNMLLSTQADWFNFTVKLPDVFYRKADKHLNALYKSEDIEKELKNINTNPNSALRELVKVIGVPADDFIAASRPGNLPLQISLRRKINKLINEKINNKFNEFYSTESISLAIDFNNGSLSFSVESNEGEAFMLSERSNGLRWYLETFIDAKAHNISDRNVLYIFDEPGVSLHVNAQRELISLFHHLVTLDNQVVYTTHSPYMLETEDGGITRIRAVVKDTEGYTRIYKTAYDARIAPDSQKDTLAPLISALGMNLNDTFGPANNKINIVIEGMSDYIYISLMMSILKVKMENYSIIPSVGASNCVNICSILHGWGCNYIAVFDYDKAGVETGGEYMHKNLFFELGKQYFYLADVTQDDIDSKTYNSPNKKCVIEDLVTQNEINRFCSLTNTSSTLSKSLIAKIMAESVISGSYELGDDCKNNFAQLFNRILNLK